MHTKMNYKAAVLILAVLLAIMTMLAGCGRAVETESAEESEMDAVLQEEGAEESEESVVFQEDAEKFQIQVFAMDTIMILTAYGEKGQEALETAEQAIYDLEEDLDPASETGSVYALNAGAGTSVAVSQDCFNVMSISMTYYDITGGNLDPGIYPLSQAWGFIGGDYRVPEAQEISNLLAAVDTGSIVLDEKTCTAMIPVGMQVGFGAVAKGYSAGRVVEIMQEAGVDWAIVSFGGDVVTLGETKPDGTLWQVAVTDPYDTGSYVGILSVGQTAVLTSGSYERYFEEDGVTYCHILDPATGYPADCDLLSVTVVMEDAAEADALSTALFVLGSDGALDFWRAQGGFELVLITTDDQVIVTPGLKDIFVESSQDYTYVYIEE